MLNWKAMQAYGCLGPNFSPPMETNPSHMAGGSWRANLHKDGTRYKPSSGGSPKPSKKSKNRVHMIPHPYNIDKHGFVHHEETAAATRA